MKQSPSLPMSLPLAGWAAWRGGMVKAQPARNTPLWQQAIHSALGADRFDLEDWAAARTTIPSLANYDDRAAEEFCGRPVQDGFLSLFKSAPRLADPLERGLEPLADLLQRGMATPEWQRLRETTVGDQVAAGVGIASLRRRNAGGPAGRNERAGADSGTGPTPSGTTPG